MSERDTRYDRARRRPNAGPPSPAPQVALQVAGEILAGTQAAAPDGYVEISIGGLNQALFDQFGPGHDDEPAVPCSNPECECLSHWKHWEIRRRRGATVYLSVGMPLRKRGL